jgi:hypothetical protein
VAAAIRADGKDDSWWRSAVGRSEPAVPDLRRPVRAEQRLLWKALFPHEPFPL